jgi:glycosyltransferase involved in cell wall biosynthesis
VLKTGGPNLRVLFTCGREPAYPRNQMIQKSLESVFQTNRITSIARHYPRRLADLYPSYLKMPFQVYDAAWVGFLGQPLVPAVRALSRSPILFDAFISLYDTLCFDRMRFAPNSLAGKLTFWLDQISCDLASTVILDTLAHAQYFIHTFHLAESKVRVLYVGCDESLFSPLPTPEDPGLVLYYGSYLPLHGIQTIIKAAQLLIQEPSIHFRIIGDGIQSSSIREMAAKFHLNNVEFTPSIPLEDLPGEISRATICLGGHFSHIPKASRVIAGKTFQCLAMGKATIVGDNPANAEILTHGKSAWFCKMNDPQALADSIRELIADRVLRERLGQAGRQTFLEKASLAILSQQIIEMTREAVSSRA